MREDAQPLAEERVDGFGAERIAGALQSGRISAGGWA
jgi:hypothetical protein